MLALVGSINLLIASENTLKCSKNRTELTGNIGKKMRLLPKKALFFFSGKYVQQSCTFLFSLKRFYKNNLLESTF